MMRSNYITGVIATDNSVGCLDELRELSVLPGALSDGLTTSEFISAGEDVRAVPDRTDGWLVVADTESAEE